MRNIRIEKGESKNERDVFVLLEKIKAGDREAFMTLTRLYQRKIFLLAFSFFQNREDALDIVQETFLRLYQKIHFFKAGRNFQNWIMQIAKNLCIDYYRKNHSKHKNLETGKNIEEMNLASDDGRNVHQASAIKDIVSRCLTKLSERQRMIFVMKHYNHLKYSEIAQIMNIAPGTVKSLHFKAVHNLRGHVSPYLGIEK